MTDDRKKKYEAKRKQITISFNVEKESDLLTFARDKKDFGVWVKDKIREEMGKCTKP